MKKKSQSESEIEQRFLDDIASKMRSGIKAEQQVPWKTYRGNFRSDFVFRASGRVVVVECDGREFHDEERDRKRDLAMLDSTAVTDIIRLRGCDIVFDTSGCIARLQASVPFLFREDAELSFESVESILLLGHTFNVGSPELIFRTRVPLSLMTRENVRMLTGNSALTIYGRCRDGANAIVQIKSPKWDWRFRGQATWEMRDVLSLMGGSK